MNNRHPTVPIRPGTTALCLLLLTACTALASVFVRWHSGRDTLRTLSALGAQTAYEANVSVNGSEGRISVLGLNDGLRNLAPSLRAMFPQSAFPNREDAMCHASWQQESDRFDLIMLDTKAGTASVALLIQQAAGGRRAPPDAYRASAMASLPMYSDAAPHFVAENQDTGTTLAVCNSSGSPAGALFFYASHLTREGWAPALPLTGTTAIFLRGQDICCITAAPSGTGRGTTITVLHKRKTIQ